MSMRNPTGISTDIRLDAYPWVLEQDNILHVLITIRKTFTKRETLLKAIYLRRCI